MSADERRAPVQGDGAHWQQAALLAGTAHAPGTITWTEHLEAWRAYDRKWRCDQSAERIEERGGFGFNELADLLGHAPTTWQPREVTRS